MPDEKDSSVKAAAPIADPLPVIPNELVKPGTAQRLSESDLEERLRLHHPELIEEIHKTVVAEVAEQKARFDGLEAKAASIRNQMGLSVTTVTVLGGALSQFKSVPLDGLAWLIAGALGISILAGTASVIFAVLAFRVRRIDVGLSERALFEDQVLKQADTTKAGADAVAIYRRFLIGYLWNISRAYFDSNEAKGKLVRVAQDAFAAFVVALVIGGIIIGVAALSGRPA